MDVVWLIGAFVFSLAALALAIAADLRTRRATRALSREMVQLRERVLALSGEGGVSESAPGGQTAAHELAELVTPRLERLERRLRELADAPPTPPAGTPRPEVEPSESRILSVLRRRGYRDVVVLETLAPDAIRIEAELDGMTVKGTARLDVEGGLEFTSVTSARAFP